jgi:hypothetical protein
VVAAIAGCGGSGGTGSGSGGPESLQPPSNVHAGIDPVSGRCILAWTPPAQPVDGYEITTSEAGWAFSDGDTHGGIAPGIATQAALDFSQTSARELTQVDIRIRSRHHGELSAFAPAVSCVLPVASPDEVVAAIQTDGIAVTWASGSSVAATIELERATLDAAGTPGSWSRIATLQALHSLDAQTQLDTAVAVGAAYGYRVSAVAPGGQRGTSRVATSLVIGAPLVASTVMLPPSDVTVTDGKGHYATFRGGFGSPLQITWGDGATWASSPAIAAQAYPPLVRLDTAGLPHTVYGKPPGSGAGVVITHGWTDGTQWLEEPIAQRSLVSFSGSQLVFDLDATGTPVPMWSLGNQRFEAATRVAGSWPVQPLDTLIAATPFGPYTVFTDTSGVPHLIVATNAGIRHIQLSGGAWTGELVPGRDGVTDGPLLGAGHDPEHLAVCFDDFASGFNLQPICVRKTAAGWGAHELLGRLPTLAMFDEGRIALSADGRRLAVVHQLLNQGASPLFGSGSHLFRSEDGGAWSEIAFPPIDPLGLHEPPQFLGFDAAGKLFTLVDPTAGRDGSAATVAYRLSSEP